MDLKREMSRRQFVTSAAAVAAISSLPARDAIAAIASDSTAGTAQAEVALSDKPGWRDQGVECSRQHAAVAGDP